VVGGELGQVEAAVGLEIDRLRRWRRGRGRRRGDRFGRLLLLGCRFSPQPLPLFVRVADGQVNADVGRGPGEMVIHPNAKRREDSVICEDRDGDGKRGAEQPELAELLAHAGDWDLRNGAVALTDNSWMKGAGDAEAIP